MKWTIVLAVAACVALAAPCGAEDYYPSRPVKLVLPQPAGGAVDLIARALADRLAEQMGRPFVVENMPGANGSLAGGNVARSPSDGYTLLLAVESPWPAVTFLRAGTQPRSPMSWRNGSLTALATASYWCLPIFPPPLTNSLMQSCLSCKSVASFVGNIRDLPCANISACRCQRTDIQSACPSS